MDSEWLLPKKERLDRYFFECQAEIQEELEAIRESQGDNDIIHHGMEESDSTSIGNLKAVAQFLRTDVFEEDEAAYQTVCRAILFSHQVSSIIHSEVLSYKLNDYIQELFESSDPQHRLDTDVRGYYLVENPSVRNILKYYARDIDQYRGYEHLIESAGGMIFMLVERSLGELFVLEDRKDYLMREYDGAN